jgi:23S rRNA (cytidine1920-2'-O)/16S rRNA (cytidine1409-2'-O)-methyltransferase
MVSKIRLDKLLSKKNFFKSRSQAKRTIMAGKVYVNDELIDKAGTQVSLESKIEIKGDNNPFVSRGGLKLEKALKSFQVNVKDKEVIDVGASTGGFTDCLLQYGAKKVYAIDVGYGQIAWKLRQNENVEVIERCNFRYLTPEDLKVKVPILVIDVSFISLRLIIPVALNFLKNNSDIIALLKPQFEAGPERVGNKGVVKNKNVHLDIIKELSEFFNKKNIYLKDFNFSPITGASSKNIEFLIHMQNINKKNNLNQWHKLTKKIVDQAHRKLD